MDERDVLLVCLCCGVHLLLLLPPVVRTEPVSEHHAVLLLLIRWKVQLVVIVVPVVPVLLCVASTRASRLHRTGRRWVAVPPSVEELVPALGVPMFDGSRGNVANVAAAFLRICEAPLVFAQAVSLGADCGTWVRVEGFEGVYLFEEVEVAFVATFERLIGFLAVKDFFGTLQPWEVRTLSREKRHRNLHPEDTNSSSP